jgi:hypothetical protein
MMRSGGISLILIILIVTIFVLPASALKEEEMQLPAFGRDTVLVWKIMSSDHPSEFVVRIAAFLPDRFLEWENKSTQGTVFIPNREILSAKNFVTSRLFESGVDTRAKGSTTLWLSRKIFSELKDKKKVKLDLDDVECKMVLKGNDQLAVEVNRSSISLPVIKVADDRGSERWFLDQEDNALLLKYTVGKYSQTLTSITTDRRNSLRWIKGRKLENLPH